MTTRSKSELKRRKAQGADEPEVQGPDGSGAATDVAAQTRTDPEGPAPVPVPESAEAAIRRLEMSRPVWSELRKPEGRVSQNRHQSGERWASFCRRMEAWEAAMAREQARKARGE